MKELLNKELKLVLHPTNILFIPLAFMLFIPNYPYLVIMFYTCLGVFFMCQFGRENNDVFFTMMLPVEKHKTVLARIISVSLLELLEIAVCVPIALLRAKIMTPRQRRRPRCKHHALRVLLYDIRRVQYYIFPGLL